MEIRELDLIAFGPFTQRRLDFSRDAGGLQVIYGPNEAGKSSALRSLRSLLFGIPARTRDNFIHDNKELRIGGRLRLGSGAELAFVRRKGNRKTLLSPDGAPIDDAALAPFLDGVTPELFETLFGIDHAALVRGGQEILDQHGEVGQALFAAALGSPALHQLLEGLEQEADALFLPRGRTPAINEALKRFQDLKKELRETLLPSARWEQQRRDLEALDKELRQLRASLAAERGEENRLRRIQRLLPKLARRRELQLRLDALGEVVLLPDDFARRREEAVQAIATARVVDTQAESRLCELRKQLEALDVSREILDQAETVDALHERLGSHRKAMQDRPRLELERALVLNDARSLLNGIRPGLPLEQADRLRPALRLRMRIAELGNRRQARVDKVRQSGENCALLQRRLAGIRLELDGLPAVPDPDNLRRTLEAAQKEGDLDREVAHLRREVRDRHDRCTAQLSSLGLWTGTLENVAGVPVPVAESLERFEKAYDALDQRVRMLEEKSDETEVARRVAARKLDELRGSGSVPAEQDLVRVRAWRDRGWQLLRRQWIDAEDVAARAQAFDPERTLADAFEKGLVDADELADRLRWEADRVQQQASLQAELEDLNRRSEALRRALREASGVRAGLDSDWQALWAPCGIRPHPPREMRRWLGGWGKLVEDVGQLGGVRRKRAEREDARALHVAALTRELDVLEKTHPGATDSLEEWLAAGGRELLAVDGQCRRRGSLAEKRDELTVDLESAEAQRSSALAALDSWQHEWRAALEPLGLEAEAVPAEATAVIENLGRLFAGLEDANRLRLRIDGIDADARIFAAEVSRLVARVCPELVGSPVEQAVDRLNGLLQEHGRRDSLQRQARQQLRDTEQQSRQARATLQTMRAQLQALCAEARCRHPEQLDEAQRRSGDYLRLKDGIDGLEREILEGGAGASLVELEREVAGVDADRLPDEIETIGRRIRDELDPRRTQLDQARGAAHNTLETMQGSGSAARLADQAQSILAGIRADAERYVRLKLAARVLRREIERYRQRNQGPLVRRASEHFAVLTRGAFEGLRVDFSEQDEPVLVGARRPGRQVPVAGMSSGTRDQLYLALRLASLEKYLENSEPMPFIVDDILVHFDDARSQATLRVLAGLADRTQVILFTHHARIAEQARQLHPARPVCVHELAMG